MEIPSDKWVKIEEELDKASPEAFSAAPAPPAASPSASPNSQENLGF